MVEEEEERPELKSERDEDENKDMNMAEIDVSVWRNWHTSMLGLFESWTKGERPKRGDR